MTNFYVAAHALIHQNGKYLATRRSDRNDYMPLKWDVPGGTVKAGEKIEAALIREIKEETNTNVKIDRVIYIYTNLDQFPIRQTFQTIYLCEYLDGEIKLNPDEHDNYAWFTKEDLRNVDAIAFLADFLNSDIFARQSL